MKTIENKEIDIATAKKIIADHDKKEIEAARKEIEGILIKYGCTITLAHSVVVDGRPIGITIKKIGAQ